MMSGNKGEEERALEASRERPLIPTRPSHYPPGVDEIHLKDYFNVILGRKWTVIAVMIAVITTVTISTFVKKPSYKSTITIRIEKENPNILGFKDVMGIERAEDDYYQTQYRILKSRSLAKRVIRALNLNKNPEFVPLSRQEEDKREESNKSALHAALLEDDAIAPGLIDSFLGRVEVSPLQKSRLVNVSFVSHSPELAARVANTIGEAFIDLNVESKFEATNQARVWLEKQLDLMKAKVEQTEEKLNEYAAKNEIIFLEKTDGKGNGTGGENMVAKRLSELSTELTAATVERIGKEALYKRVASGDAETSSVVMSNALVMELKKNYASSESEYNEQLKIYKPDYPKMVRLRELINQLKKRLDQEMKRVISSVRKDYEVAVKRERQLRAALDSQKKEALEFNQRIIQYQILSREADTNKELYNGLLQRLKETGVSASLTASNIQVLDKAEVPKAPFKPNKRLNIMLSIIVGLLGGVGLAFFTEYLDNTIKTPEDVEKRVSLPQLGLIPYFAENKGQIPVEQISNSHGRSQIAEAYRSIRTILLLSNGGKPAKIMMVTSPMRSEGKTTTAINTAIILTKSEAKVVLIDADMRKPKLHDLFSLDNGLGLSSFLSGEAEFDSGIIQQSAVENLHIISSGPIPENPAELVGSSYFQELLCGLYPLYDFVIIDTPPVLGISDPLIIGPRADGVIMVVRSGMTDKDAAWETRRMLESVHANILGVVLNSIEQTTIKYGYYKYCANEKK